MGNQIKTKIDQLQNAWSGKNSGNHIKISCMAIPKGLFLLAIIVFIIATAVFWTLFSDRYFSQFYVILIVLQVVLVPCLIYYLASMKLHFSRRGIQIISFIHQTAMFNRMERQWSDLHSVRLRRVVSPDFIAKRVDQDRTRRFSGESKKRKMMDLFGYGWWQSGFLVLDFKSGGSAYFPLGGFSTEELEKFFLAISRWSGPMVLNPDVIALERNVLTGQPLVLDETYTKMWEESLKQQFEVTNFIPLQAGQVLKEGSLEVMMLLACGGTSSVYLAKRNDGTRVVVKEMRVSTANEPGGSNRLHDIFSKEAKILSKLDHPNIVHVLDHFVEDGRDYLVLEYVHGYTLRQHVQMHGPFSEEEAIIVAKKMAEITQYIHDFDPPILHKDLTPDNIILKEPDREVMLVDFGAANEYVADVTGTLVGKQCYIPPEQFRGKAVPASDMYALAASLFFILTGKDPEPISPSKPKDLVDTINDELNQLIYDSTLDDPEDRKYDAKQFYEKICEIANSIESGA